MLRTLNYRSDVDGLRAVAVVPVVLFHLNIDAFSGGFVGVDIFFVISGFLITSILSKHCRDGSFSLLDFYARRVKRIFPVLFVVVLATLAAGYLLLSPGDYESTAKSAIFTVTFLSNFYFWLNTGYFDASAETMPLLHTWSLGVEEQFYIVWPLLILGLWKLTSLRGRAFWYVLTAVTIVSFIACVVVTTHDPERAFYLPWFRGWQFAMGAAISFLPAMKRGNHAASLTGIALIAYAVFGFDEATAFPGYSAFVPTLGAALILVAGPAGIANRVLSTAPFVMVGLISYSLYLWHWPVTVLYQHYSIGPLSLQEIVTLVALMTGLSVLSYFAVERPFRRVSLPSGRIVMSGAGGGIAVAMVALLVVQNTGFPSRIPHEMKKIANLDVMWQWECPQLVRMEVDGKQRKACVLGSSWETAKRRGVLWGDSHAEHFAPLMDRVGKRLGISLVLRKGCAAFFVPGVFREYRMRPKYSETCWARNAAISEWINRNSTIELVFIANAWAGYAPDLYEAPERDASETTYSLGAQLMGAGLESAIDRISRDKSIVLMGDVPRPFFEVPPCVIRIKGGLLQTPCEFNTEMIPMESLEKRQIPTYRAIEKVARKSDSVHFFNPSIGLCNSEGCPTFVNHELIYRDSNHLRRNLSSDTFKSLISKMGLTPFLTNTVLIDEARL